MTLPISFPRTLDGANVSHATLAPSGVQGWAYDTGEPIPVVYLAIASYPSDAGVYLFLVSEKFEVIGDTLWDSVAKAMEAALSSEVAHLSWLELPVVSE